MASLAQMTLALPQALKWPRSGATCNGVQADCSVIPYKIENATAVLAISCISQPQRDHPAWRWWWREYAVGHVRQPRTLGDLSISTLLIRQARRSVVTTARAAARLS